MLPKSHGYWVFIHPAWAIYPFPMGLPFDRLLGRRAQHTISYPQTLLGGLWLLMRINSNLLEKQLSFDSAEGNMSITRQ